MSLEQIDGGPGYYGGFARPLPTGADFFPIAVWGSYDHTQTNRDTDADVGLNTYVWVADNYFMPEIRADGRFRVIQAQGARENVGAETTGWEMADEIDMTDGPGACNGRLQTIKDGLPPDGRLRYNNYGKGVLLWHTDAQAACFVDAQDVASSDLYWFTDPWQVEMVAPRWLPEWDPDPDDEVITGARVRRAANYGYQVDRMRALDARDGHRKPIWAFVETGWPFEQSAAEGARAIAPAEVRAAVWHSLIAGARGVIYFNHSFGGPASCRSHHVLRDVGCYAAIRAMVKSVNAQIKTLAPVLNAPTLTSGWTASARIRFMVKWYDGHFFLFGGSRNDVGSTGAFSMPCIGDATAVRLGESGSVAVTNGQLSDTFQDGNAIHIYRIDGGSSCGLPPAAPGGGLPGPDRSTRRGARVGRLPRRIPPRSRRLRVPIRCTAECTVRSRLTTRQASRRVLLAAARRRFSPGRHKVVLRLSRRDRRRVAGGRVMRLQTVIVQPGGGARLTQRLVLRRR